MSGFSVTSYTLDIVNKTNGETTKIILEQSELSQIMTYDLKSSDLPVMCHFLTFSVIATNQVGDSPTGNTVTLGFPICK